MFRNYVKHFWIFPRERNCSILIGLCKEMFMNHPIMFLDRDNKMKLVSATFSYFLELRWEKNKFLLKSVVVIKVIISLHYKETNETVSFTLLLQKSSWKIKWGEFQSDQKELAKWRAIRASVGGVDDVLMWVAWLHWGRASVSSVGGVGGVLAWVAWWHAINIVIVIIEILSWRKTFRMFTYETKF